MNRRRTVSTCIGARVQIMGALVLMAALPATAGGPGFVTVRSYQAPSARQAVVADAKYFYAIGNHSIDKYDRATGVKTGAWAEAPDGPIHHLNSGVLINGELLSAHSNYPGIPMTSSIERFDPATLEHTGSHSFGIQYGSATWIDRHDGAWWVAFAHYGHIGGGGKRGGQPGKGPEWTSLVRFDDQFRRTGGWVYPADLVARFAPSSNSGGLFARDGTIWVTGHDAAEIYVQRLPKAGSVLDWIETIPAPIAGQGIALDPTDEQSLWGIVKKSGVVVHSRRAER
jgi:hypothetical protein